MKRIIFDVVFAICFMTVSIAGQIMSNPAQWYINNQIYPAHACNGVVANSMLRKGAGRKTAAKSAAKTTIDYTSFKTAPANILPKQLSAKSPNKSETEQIL